MGITATQRRDFVRTLVTVYDELHEKAGPPKDQVGILAVRRLMNRAPADVVIHTASVAHSMFQWFSITGIMDPSFKRLEAGKIIEIAAKAQLNQLPQSTREALFAVRDQHPELESCKNQAAFLFFLVHSIFAKGSYDQQWRVIHKTQTTTRFIDPFSKAAFTKGVKIGVGSALMRQIFQFVIASIPSLIVYKIIKVATSALALYLTQTAQWVAIQSSWSPLMIQSTFFALRGAAWIMTYPALTGVCILGLGFIAGRIQALFRIRIPRLIQTMKILLLTTSFPILIPIAVAMVICQAVDRSGRSIYLKGYMEVRSLFRDEEEKTRAFLAQCILQVSEERKKPFGANRLPA